MSRSYKKAVFKSGGSKRKVKRLASKKVRRTPDIPNGGAYKKVFESWEINDWAFFERLNNEIKTFYPNAKRTKSGWIINK